MSAIHTSFVGLGICATLSFLTILKDSNIVHFSPFYAAICTVLLKLLLNDLYLILSDPILIPMLLFCYITWLVTEYYKCAQDAYKYVVNYVQEGRREIVHAEEFTDANEEDAISEEEVEEEGEEEEELVAPLQPVEEPVAPLQPVEEESAEEIRFREYILLKSEDEATL